MFVNGQCVAMWTMCLLFVECSRDNMCCDVSWNVLVSPDVRCFVECACVTGCSMFRGTVVFVHNSYESAGALSTWRGRV